mgnify:CR=1 FL=1
MLNHKTDNMMKNMIKCFLALTLTGMTNNAVAQQLSVQPIEAGVNEQATLVVTAGNMTGFTAMQFTLSLPEGIVIAENAITKGEAVANHELTMCSLTNGDRMFVIYNMDLNTFKNGELLRIPVTIGSNAKSGEGELSIIRFSTTESVSSEGANVKFNLIVTGQSGDVNGDGSITAQDASLVLQLVAKKITPTTEGVIYNAADVYGDGEVTAQDASLILQHVAKKIDLSNLNN